jgi:hypothetical protein
LERVSTVPHSHAGQSQNKKPPVRNRSPSEALLAKPSVAFFHGPLRKVAATPKVCRKNDRSEIRVRIDFIGGDVQIFSPDAAED